MLYVEAFTNLNPRARRDGYAFGDELQLCYAAWRQDLAGLSDEEALERVFEDLNDDDRPNLNAFPSLSDGDVVSLMPVNDASPDRSSHAVEPAGWYRLPLHEQWATPAEHHRYRAALGLPPLVRIEVRAPYQAVCLWSLPPGIEVEISYTDPDNAAEPFVLETYPPPQDGPTEDRNPQQTEE